jgi:hypothetical protein
MTTTRVLEGIQVRRPSTAWSLLTGLAWAVAVGIGLYL